MKINDSTTYEFGILSGESRKYGNHTNPTFSKNRDHSWPGGSLSWQGKRFRQADRRRIRTFADYLNLNPDGMPTGKTFYFYEITIDQDERRRRLVHEGMFAATSMISGSPIAPARHTPNMGLSDDTAIQGRATISAMQENIIQELQRDKRGLEAEIKSLRDEITQLRKELREGQEKILNIDGERIKFQVEKDSLEAAHKLRIEQLEQDHKRTVDRMIEDHERALDQARAEGEDSAVQSLSDEMESNKAKLQNVALKVMENLPEYLETAKGLKDMVQAFFTKDSASKASVPANATPTAETATQFPSPYAQAIESGYEIAEHGAHAQAGMGAHQ